MASAQEILNEAKAYAAEIQGQAKESVEAATSAINAFIVPVYTTSYGLSEPLPKEEFSAPPTQEPIDFTEPAEPDSSPVLQEISALEIGLIPEFAVVPPTFTAPTKPAEMAAFLAQAPSITTDIAFPALPGELSLPLPLSPVITDRAAPTAPIMALPSMDTMAPVFDGVTPTDLPGKFSAAYRESSSSAIGLANGYVDAQLLKFNPRYTEQMARIETQLSKYLDGGTGLAPAVEDAIYARARGKNDAEARRVRDASYGEAAGRGFTLPTGALMSAMQQARQASADNNARAASDIVVMQAEMEQKNLQFAVSASASLRATMVNATLSYMQSLVGLNGQALDSAKSLLGATIELYNAQVKAFSVRLDGYRAEAAYYELKLKGALAKIEVYRGEISAMEALGNVDQLRVNLHRSRIDAISSLAGMYKTQVEAVVSRASLEKLKLDLFQSQVQSHSAQVQAKNAEWQGYSAQISGQAAQAGLYSEQARAHNTRIEGIKLKLGAQVETIKAQIATNQSKTDKVKAATEIFSTVARARTSMTASRIDLQKQELASYSEKLKSEIAMAQWGMDRYKTVANYVIESEKIKLEAYKTNANLQVAQMKALSDVSVAGAGIEGNLASAAMSGINAVAVLSETI